MAMSIEEWIRASHEALIEHLMDVGAVKTPIRTRSHV